MAFQVGDRVKWSEFSHVAARTRGEPVSEDMRGTVRDVIYGDVPQALVKWDDVPGGTGWQPLGNINAA